MDHRDLLGRLEFLRAAEQLKDTLRSAYTKNGRTESTAEHSWRLTLFAMTFADQFPDLDEIRVLKTCVLHDLGECVNGDIPAPQQDPSVPKSDAERRDFISVIASLPASIRADYLDLWDDYENGTTAEARLVKALDKLETILQHNQGKNPEDFDYAFNLGYGRGATDAWSLTATIRDLLDQQTSARAAQRDRVD
ncbi:MAG: HD domain-containing protein [Pseudomonadota bacterium]